MRCRRQYYYQAAVYTVWPTEQETTAYSFSSIATGEFSHRYVARRIVNLFCIGQRKGFLARVHRDRVSRSESVFCLFKMELS
jgi:hypothetical protein